MAKRLVASQIDELQHELQVPARHPATRGYRCHWDAEAGVQHSTAGKSVVWDERHRLLVSKDAEGELMTIESRQAEVRRPLMAVKPMTQQGQWVCFGPDRALATGRVIPFESTPSGWNLRVEFSKHQMRPTAKLQASHGHHDETEKIEHMRGLPHAIKQNVVRTEGCVFFSTFSVAGHRLVRPQERSLIPLTVTDGDETMMDNPGDDDGWGTCAVK